MLLKIKETRWFRSSTKAGLDTPVHKGALVLYCGQDKKDPEYSTYLYQEKMVFLKQKNFKHAYYFWGIVQ